jgi:hypothetical protein
MLSLCDGKAADNQYGIVDVISMYQLIEENKERKKVSYTGLLTSGV